MLLDETTAALVNFVMGKLMNSWASGRLRALVRRGEFLAESPTPLGPRSGDKRNDKIFFPDLLIVSVVEPFYSGADFPSNDV